MKRTTSLHATFSKSVRSSGGGSAIFWLRLLRSNLRTKIGRRSVLRRAKPGYADCCSPNAAARETRLPGPRRWNAQLLRPFLRAHWSVLLALVFEAPIILSPLFFQLRRQADHKR